MDKFTQALAALLPTGFAWPRNPDSVLMRVLRGMAGAFDALHQFSQLTVARWQPHTTTRLAEWEAACGLPDLCFGAQTEAERRRLLLARLRGPQLAYRDSSPVTLQTIQDICTALGYNVSIRYNQPFRVGRDRVGQRLGTNNGIIYIVLVRQAEPFRVGVNRVGDRLVQYSQDAGPLICYLQRIVPARFAIQIIAPPV
jgi:uncharacterized protein YmfQ (DUF2313 family)